MDQRKLERQSGATACNIALKSLLTNLPSYALTSLGEDLNASMIYRPSTVTTKRCDCVEDHFALKADSMRSR